jgi:peptidoglycan/LPS O-acetylase OafA/YrhL
MLAVMSTNQDRFPDLDALRFLSFAGIFITHAAFSIGYKSSNPHVEMFKHTFLSLGELGVNFFFVLSGFLITWLLIREVERTGTIALKGFYLRRIVRVVPVYYVVVLISFLVVPSLISSIDDSFPMRIGISEIQPLLYFTFLGNFDYITNGINNTVIASLWSLSVEMQFYFIWPLVLLVLPRKWWMVFFAALVAGAIIYRGFFSDAEGLNLKYHSLSCMGDLAMGALLAAFSARKSFRDKMAVMPRYLILLIYLAACILLWQRLNLSSWKEGKYVVGAILPFLFSLFFAFVIAEQNFAERSFFKFRKVGLFGRAGEYAYGMYSYHMLAFFFVLFITQLLGFSVSPMDVETFIVTVLITILITVLLALLSYHAFEQPLLKRVRKPLAKNDAEG